MVYKFQHSFFLALLFCRKYDSFFLVLIFFCKHGKKLSTYMYHNNLIKHLYRSNNVNGIQCILGNLHNVGAMRSCEKLSGVYISGTNMIDIFLKIQSSR